jgi:hypothetical protein
LNIIAASSQSNNKESMAANMDTRLRGNSSSNGQQSDSGAEYNNGDQAYQ